MCAGCRATIGDFGNYICDGLRFGCGFCCLRCCLFVFFVVYLQFVACLCSIQSFRVVHAQSFRVVSFQPGRVFRVCVQSCWVVSFMPDRLVPCFLCPVVLRPVVVSGCFHLYPFACVCLQIWFVRSLVAWAFVVVGVCRCNGQPDLRVVEFCVASSIGCAFVFASQGCLFARVVFANLICFSPMCVSLSFVCCLFRFSVFPFLLPSRSRFCCLAGRSIFYLLCNHIRFPPFVVTTPGLVT